MSCTKLLPSLILFICFLRLSAQEAFQAIWEPQIALNYDVLPAYSHNFSISNRNYLYRDGEFTLAVRRADVAHFSGWKFSDNQSLALGIQYRFRESFDNSGDNELRLTQQYDLRHGDDAVRLGHRFRAEQRFRPGTVVHRFRYRLALDSPLQGEKLNVGEPYIVGSVEALLSIAVASAPEYDQRFQVSIGWLLRQGIKLEAGLQFRLEDYTRDIENLVFLTNNLVISL